MLGSKLRPRECGLSAFTITMYNGVLAQLQSGNSVQISKCQEKKQQYL